MPDVNDKSLPVLSAPPHIKTGDSINRIMWTFAAVLMLPVMYSIYLFGFNAAKILVVCTITGVVSEAVFQLLMKRKIKVLNGSSVITGLLVGMNVPPGFPLWISALGTIIAVVIFKELFGGLGNNLFNPALAGRAFMMIIWPAQMTTYRSPEHIITGSGSIPAEIFNVITQASPLAALKNGLKMFQDYNIPVSELYYYFTNSNVIKTLLIRNTGRCIGETSVLLIIICGLLLMWRKIITWHIPFSFIGSVAIVSYSYYYFNGMSYPGFFTLIHILSGGTFFGAVFMATDMVTSPLTPAGRIIFGFGCGIITFSIRILSGFPEGVTYAILLMNITVPLIDRLTTRGFSGLTSDWR